MIALLSILSSFFILSTSVVAQGRPGTTRGSVFMGCYPDRPQSSTNTPTRVANAAGAAACATNCGNINQIFSYFQLSTGQCWCNDQYQLPDKLLTSNLPCQNGNWAYSRVTTTFRPYGDACRAFNGVGLPASSYTAVQGPPSCHRQCRSFRFAYWWADTNANLWKCACSNDVRVQQDFSFTCTANSVFVWEHSPEAQASALDRKKKRDQLALAAADQTLCPAGMNACLVPGLSGSYECLDTSSELDSCGGCTNGELSSNGTISYASSGSDCTAGGALMGAATCILGQCSSIACKKGYELVDGFCLRTLQRSA